MPISPIVLQRRHAELGRIRLGAKRNGNGAPMKLESFRFTSASQRYIEDLAALYGGEAREWDNNGKAEWEVYTDAKTIPVIAVKGGLSQWLETWSGGGCVHRCDGEKQVDGTMCNPDDKAHVDAKPTTRLSVMLPELEAVGVFRLESHGWNAAAEIPAVAELATFVGDLVPANLHLVERRSIKDGKTSRFVVPVLDLQIGAARLREIVNLKSGGELPAGAGEQKALEAGDTAADPYVDARGLVEAATTLDELAGVWTGLVGDKLLGPEATVTPLHDAFVEAWKARAHEIKAATDTPSGDDDDPDAVWRDILATAGALEPPMTEDQVKVDVQDTIGVAASAASAGELGHYLSELKSRQGQAA